MHDFVKDATVNFYAVYVDDADVAEKWLLRQFNESKLLNDETKLLNIGKTISPKDIPVELGEQESLKELFERSII